MGDLDGRRVVVTGAASGIGRAAVVLLLGRGAVVMATDRDDEGLGALQRALGRETLEVRVGDAADETLARELAAWSAGGERRPLGFFANAGMLNSIEPLDSLEAGPVRELLEVNLMGPLFALKHAGPALAARGGGSIVCTASVAALRAGAGPAHYSASKAAVVSLVQNAAFQLGGTGVRVNALLPGLIETGMTRPMFDLARARGREDRIGQLNPLRRAGRPEEVAEVAAFLLSDASSYVNGAAIVVDGGLSAAHPHVPGKLW